MKFLHAFCLASIFVASQSYARVVVTVNTTNDENGENLANCSLREAVHAINTHNPFGGCAAGEIYGTNIISLANATYVLSKGELTISHEVTINGVSTANAELEDTITGTKPKRMPPSTTIDGNLKRIFNTAVDKKGLTLRNLILTRGKADLGGAILAGGQITLEYVVLSDNEATVAGGAIYLSGRDTGLSILESTLTKNKANKGAVLGMSCIDYLAPVSRSITIASSSMIGNGGDDNISVIHGCGQTSLTIDTSTVAQNTANAMGGILYFADSQLNNTSTLTINSSTVVENKIAPALTYDALGLLSLNSSIIAFNDMGCVAKTGNLTLYNGVDSIGAHNTLQKCPLKYSSTNTSPKLDILLEEYTDANFATELHPLADNGGYTLTYLPKLSSKYILNKSASALCKSIDQRGSNTASTQAATICDAGSVERRSAVAVFDATKIFLNQDESNRTTDVDVLENDIPSETETTRGELGKDPVTGQYLIQLTETANNRCAIVHKENQRPIIRFDNKGIPLEDARSVTCKYKFTDSNGSLSTEGLLQFRTINKPPVATDDSYTLASGTSIVSFDLLSNDHDKNDGIYGGLCTDANNVNCNGFYIRVVSQPTVGVIEAERKGNCPDYDDGNKYTCYGGRITYRSKNTLSPFDDKFTYVVYDIDKTASNEATVTIINQTGANEESGSGSLGLFSLLGLGGLAFYRRFRKSYVD
jgi:CSLREA domain-containing protein